jgi:hypothetical protein
MAHGGYRPGAGRKKGAASKLAIGLESIDAINSVSPPRQRKIVLELDPLEILAWVAERRVPCGTCIDANRRPTGRTKYRLPAGKHAHGCSGIPLQATNLCACEGIGTRTCESCFGTLWERIPVSEMRLAARDLAPYRYPQLRSIEHTGDAQPGSRQIEVVYVDARPIQPGVSSPRLMDRSDHGD